MRGPARNTIRIAFLMISVLVSAAPVVSDDRVTTVDGREFHGRIVALNDAAVMIEVDGGRTVLLKKAEIREILRDSTATTRPTETQPGPLLRPPTRPARSSLVPYRAIDWEHGAGIEADDPGSTSGTVWAAEAQPRGRNLLLKTPVPYLVRGTYKVFVSVKTAAQPDGPLLAIELHSNNALAGEAWLAKWQSAPRAYRTYELMMETEQLKDAVVEVWGAGGRDVRIDTLEMIRFEGPALEADDKKRGITRIRFDTPRAMASFVTARPEQWKIVDGELVGKSVGNSRILASTENMHITYRKYFVSISKVEIRGRIIPPSKSNFRLSVGPLSMIFNWELGDENHFKNGRERTRRAGYLLQPGRTQTIALEQVGTNAVLTVDGTQVWTTPVRLEGTVTIFPAAGDTIGVSQITIAGIPDDQREVRGPSHASSYSW